MEAHDLKTCVETLQTFITVGWCGVPTNVKHLYSVSYFPDLHYAKAKAHSHNYCRHSISCQMIDIDLFGHNHSPQHTLLSS